VPNYYDIHNMRYVYDTIHHRYKEHLSNIILLRDVIALIPHFILRQQAWNLKHYVPNKALILCIFTAVCKYHHENFNRDNIKRFIVLTRLICFLASYDTYASHRQLLKNRKGPTFKCICSRGYSH
jgi:hypothetical protein